MHEWFILLNREVEYVWQTEWGVGKILYIVSRYAPFIDMPITIASKSSFLFVTPGQREYLRGFRYSIAHTASYGVIDLDVGVNVVNRPLRADKMKHSRHAIHSIKSPLVREKTSPLELVRVQMLLAGYREYCFWDRHLGMSGIVVAAASLGTHPCSFTAILLLRTSAIYSKSKWVTIPLSVAYAVRPRDFLVTALCGSRFPRYQWWPGS